MPRQNWKRSVYILALAQFFTAVGFSSFFPFLPLYISDLGSVSGLSLELLSGLVYSGQAFTMMLASPVWGALADRYGRKLMFGGALVLLMMAFVRSAEELVLLRALQGLITGTVSAAATLIAATTPRQQMGYAMGLLELGMGTGIAVGPLLGGVSADWFGYHATFYGTALLLLLSGLLVWWGVEDAQPVEKQPLIATGSFWSEWKTVLTNAGLNMVFSMRFISTMGRMLILPIVPLLVVTLMHDDAQVNTMTGLVTGVAAGATTLSTVYLGRLGDRLGHRGVLIACLAVTVPLYGLQTWVGSAWQLLLLQALVGVAMGGVLPATNALLAEFSSGGHEGAVYGLDNSINSAGRAVAPLVGSTLALFLGLRAVFAGAALLFLAAALLALKRSPGRVPAQVDIHEVN
jgi:DHA1 family multidrug resistance protein-like MFS transporter